MRELRAEIIIEAPPKKVWGILIDFDRWGDWNPVVTQLKGVGVPGAKLTVTMGGAEGKKGHQYEAVVTKMEELKLFRWRAKMGAEFLFANDKIIELEESGSGTRLVHREQFSGILVPMFWGKMKEGAQPLIQSMNEALKTKAEKGSN